MTALTQYTSLEGIGKWRSDRAANPLSVGISLGKRTLMIQDVVSPDRVIAHWDLAAISRRGTDPEWGICYSIGAGRPEELWISADQTDLINALNTLEEALSLPAPHKPRPWGRIISVGIGLAAIGFVAINASGWKASFMAQSLTEPMRHAISQTLIETLIAQDALCTVPQNDTLFAELNTSLGHSATIYLDQRDGQSTTRLSKYAILLPQQAFEPINDQHAAVSVPQAEAPHDPLGAAMSELSLVQSLRFWLSGRLTDAAQDQILSRLSTMSQPNSAPEVKKITGALYERLLSKCFSSAE